MFTRHVFYVSKACNFTYLTRASWHLSNPKLYYRLNLQIDIEHVWCYKFNLPHSFFRVSIPCNTHVSQKLPPEFLLLPRHSWYRKIITGNDGVDESVDGIRHRWLITDEGQVGIGKALDEGQYSYKGRKDRRTEQSPLWNQPLIQRWAILSTDPAIRERRES